jgi:hypothetical protein
MNTGNLRVSYYAVATDGTRAELLAAVVQNDQGGFDPVFTSDPRPILRVLELRDGDAWREVRAEPLPAGPPRVLPGPYG